MKIVIDVPEEMYRNGTLIHYFGCYSVKLDEIIYNGDPFPKVYEDLIKKIQNLPTQESVDGQGMLQAYDVIRTIKEYCGGDAE